MRAEVAEQAAAPARHHLVSINLSTWFSELKFQRLSEGKSVLVPPPPPPPPRALQKAPLDEIYGGLQQA